MDEVAQTDIEEVLADKPFKTVGKKNFLTEESYLSWVNGSAKGGRNSSGYEYGHGKVSPVENGRKGGAVSRRKAKS